MNYPYGKHDLFLPDSVISACHAGGTRNRTWIRSGMCGDASAFLVKEVIHRKATAGRRTYLYTMVFRLVYQVSRGSTIKRKFLS